MSYTCGHKPYMKVACVECRPDMFSTDQFRPYHDTELVRWKARAEAAEAELAAYRQASGERGATLMDLHAKAESRAERVEADARVMANAFVKLSVYSEPLIGVGILPTEDLAAAIERWRSR